MWDSRYQSSLLQAETYVFTCMRCIELNTVRAARVDDPAHYRWISYRSNALGQDYALLTPHTLYLDLEAIDKERQVADRVLFRYQLDQEAISDIRLALSQNQPLGNERFNANIERMNANVVLPGKEAGRAGRLKRIVRFQPGRQSLDCEQYRPWSP